VGNVTLVQSSTDGGSLAHPSTSHRHRTVRNVVPEPNPHAPVRRTFTRATDRADERAGAATAPVGRAEDHAVGWRDARRATGAWQLSATCERRDSQQDGPNAPGWAASEERATTSVRRVGGEATLQAPPSRRRLRNAKNSVPEVSLRRRRVLLVAARSSPCGAARGTVKVR